jgi:NADH dehydrogenase
VLIAGGGFAGAYVARLLGRRGATIVSPENFMLYTPLLPEAASGTLEPRHTVVPLRQMCPRAELLLGRVTSIDEERRLAHVETPDAGAFDVAYEQLVLALGAVPRTFPVPGLAEHAIGFKTLADAIWLRNHVIETLEAANATDDAARREELLTYVFVGGGYAGLEALAELQDFATDAIESYPRARLHGMRWVLVEAADRVLPEIDAELADYALRELRGRGIDIRLGTMLEELNADSARLSTGETLPTRTAVWTAGVAPHPSLRELSLPLDERGRVPVDDHLRVRGMDAVWAIGDCAATPDPRGGLSPPTAQHAVRQGPVAARNIAAELGVGAPGRFEYRGSAAFVNLGRYKAVGRVGGRTFRGFPAWWMARTYHMSQIPGIARKTRAVIDWTASLPFRRDVAELGSIGHPKSLRSYFSPHSDKKYDRRG